MVRVCQQQRLELAETCVLNHDRIKSVLHLGLGEQLRTLHLQYLHYLVAILNIVQGGACHAVYTSNRCHENSEVDFRCKELWLLDQTYQELRCALAVAQVCHRLDACFL